MGLPEASRQLEGAKKSCPSSGRRMITHRARVAPAGGATHEPGAQRNRSPSHSQPPSAQTRPDGVAGRSGTSSTGGERGEYGTGT